MGHDVVLSVDVDMKERKSEESEAVILVYLRMREMAVIRDMDLELLFRKTENFPETSLYLRERHDGIDYASSSNCQRADCAQPSNSKAS